MTRLLYNVNIPRFFVSHRLPLALAAREAGYDVHVTTANTDEEQMEIIRATRLPYHPLKLSQHGTNPLSEMDSFHAILGLYRGLQPDIVHHVTIKPVLYGGLAARLAGVKGVVGAMSGLGHIFIDDSAKSRLLRQIANPMFKLVLSPPNTRMIFQNPDDQARFIRLGLIDAAKTVLIRGSGVDMDVFSPQAEPSGKPVILFAGRLMWRKGLGDFVEAARQLRHQARFVVVGYAEATSPDNVPLEQLEAWQAEGLIEWLGKRDDMPQVFAESHIVCLPSSYGEGVPKVLIEAAACARPIVTTDTAGCREITRQGENGFLVPPHDVSALVNALTPLIQDATLRQNMGARGRQIALTEFDLPQVLQRTFQVYEELNRAK